MFPPQRYPALILPLTLLGVAACGAASPPESSVDAEATVAASPTGAPSSTGPKKPPPRRNTEIPKDEFPMDPVTHVLKLPGPILYDTGKATLKNASDGPLGFVKDYLERNPGVTTLRIEGHSDDRGSAKMNAELTRNRAKAAAEWLIAHGIDCHRLIAVGFGERKPIADNKTNEGRVANRRIDFVEAAYQNRPTIPGALDAGGDVAELACP
ncbi:MAG: OmpA family protein [Polyangiaceae bacterium]